MSRLIDADALLQEFETENVAHNSDIWHITGIKAFIENAPTAFDTEKVVEQLNNVLQDLNVIEILSQFDPDSTIQTSLDRFLNAVRNEVLNIVKKGGWNEHGLEKCLQIKIVGRL